MPEVVFRKGDWTYSWNEATRVLAVARVTALMSLWPESLWTGDPQYGFRGVLHEGLYPGLRDRVPGPLAAGPGGSGLTRGASDAEKGVEADSQPRTSDGEQGRCALQCGHPGHCYVVSD